MYNKIMSLKRKWKKLRGDRKILVIVTGTGIGMGLLTAVMGFRNYLALAAVGNSLEPDVFIKLERKAKYEAVKKGIWEGFFND